MNEPELQAVPAKWNIPPPGQSGDVPWLTRIMMGTKAVWVARPSELKERELLGVLKETCQEMGITPVPKLLIYNSTKPNAASAVLSGDILFSTNILDILPREKIKAVMGHELTHHQNRGKTALFSVANLLLSSVAAFFAFKFTQKKFSEVRLSDKLERRDGVITNKLELGLTPMGEFINTVSEVGIFLGSLAAQMWFQRRSELGADRGGVKVAGERPMIEMLDALKTRSQEIKEEEKIQGKTDWGKYSIMNLPFFRSHPTIEQRIKNIITHAPGGHVENYSRELNDKPDLSITNNLL